MHATEYSEADSPANGEAGSSVLTVAQVGCGYWGPNLLRNLWANTSCRVKTVVDTSAERRSYVEQNFPGIRATGDWMEVVRDPEIDAVVIATPAADHYQLTKTALLSGKHALVEKPLALHAYQAEELGQLSRAQGRKLMVGHTFLYNAAVRHFRDLIDKRDAGEIFYFHVQRLNLGKVRSDVNAWWNLAPHDISILLYLMNGELPESITATGMDYLQPGVEDVVFARLTWPNRVTAHVHVSWLDPHKVRRMTLVGSRKMVVYDDVSDNKIMVLDKGFDVVPRAGQGMDYDQPTNFQLVHRKGDVVLPKIDFEEPLKVEIAHFVDCIENDRVPLTGPEHARDVVAILEAGQRSLDRNREIMGMPEFVTEFAA